MSEPPRQFYQETTSKDLSDKTGRMDRAIYKLPGKDRNAVPLEIAVEVVQGGGNVPRNAASLKGLTREISTDWDAEFKSVAAVAESVLNSLKALRLDEVQIEFGVELGGELGIPLVTKGEAKANFKITMKWKESQNGPRKAD